MKISYSSLRTFQTCPKSYWYRYHAGRIPRQVSDVLFVGTAAHETTSIWWTDGPSAARDYLFDRCDAISPLDAARLAATLSVYNPPRDDFEIEGIEVPFKVTVKNPDTDRGMKNIRLIGFADMILVNKRTGKRVIREYKTTASEIVGFGPFWSRIAIDTQISIYALAFGISDIVYDVTRKPALRVSAADRKEAGADATEAEIYEAFCRRVSAKCADNPGEWHQWREIHKSSDDINTARRSIFEAVKQLKHSTSERLWPMHTHSCANWGSCKYLDVCAGRACLDDDEMFEDYERSI